MRGSSKYQFALSLLLVAAVSCGQSQADRHSIPAYFGRAAVRWTLNGKALNAEDCKTQGIAEMLVEVDSLYGYGEAVVFEGVDCDLDRYSMDTLPGGPVRIFVDALNGPSTRQSCARFSGQIDLTTNTQYPSQPTPIALHRLANCP